MSWEFSIPPSDTPDQTITVRNAELGDVEENIHRQVAGETDAGQVFVEDLGVVDAFLDVQFASLSIQERADMERFFGPQGANRRALPFAIEVSGRHLMVGLNTGQTINGVPLNTGQGFNTGDRVVPDTARLAIVFLDQSRIDWNQPRPRQFSAGMRFRIHAGPIPDLTG